MQIQYDLQCSEKIGVIEFTNTLFIADFELQTNKMLFFENGNLTEPVYERILTVKTFKNAFDFSDPERLITDQEDTAINDLKEIEAKRRELLNPAPIEIEDILPEPIDFAEVSEQVKNAEIDF